jgi:surfactin synthase thioesterase subunit
MSQPVVTSAACDSWIAYRKPRPSSRMRLFCFPYAGAGALIFRTWQDGLPAEVEVCPVQLPGRGPRLMEPPFTQVAPLVEALTQALLPLLDKPFSFFGHSLGALVGFELARQLRRHYHLHPTRLFVSSAPAPHIRHRDLPIHTLPEVEFLAELHRLNGTPNELLEHKELMEIMVPLLRADFALYETYRCTPEPPLTCPLTAFGGLEDRKVSHGDLAGWRDQTSADFSLKMFPGDHFFLNTNQPLLLRALSQDLQ